MKPTLTLLTALPLAPLAVLDAAEPVTIDLAQRTWQGIPGIERTAKGRVFVSWFTGGTKEPEPENTLGLLAGRDGGADEGRLGRIGVPNCAVWHGGQRRGPCRSAAGRLMAHASRPEALCVGVFCWRGAGCPAGGYAALVANS
jgi:hypothetical protein